MTVKSLLAPVNGAVYLCTCALAGTGLLLELRMDAEDGAVRILGMNRDDWRENHIITAIAFLATTAFHLGLNWAWIKSAVAKARWAVPLLAGGLGLILALLLWPSVSGATGGSTRTVPVAIDEH
jgi:hypothetical protein